MCILCRFRVPNLNDMTGYNVGKGIVPRPTIMIIMSTTSAATDFVTRLILNRLVRDMTLTLKKMTLTLKMGSDVHLPQHGHVLLWLCY